MIHPSRSPQDVLALNLTIRMGDIRRGGYVLSESADGRAAQVVLIGTGSETSLSVQAQKILASEGIAVRVVSMPSTSVLGWQAPIWQDAVLPHGCRAVAIEATHPDFWRKYVGRQGAVVGLSTYGESAPAKDLYAYFGITAQAGALAARQVMLSPVKAPDALAAATGATA